MAQYFMYPMKTLSVSQGYGIAVDGVKANSFSHLKTHNIDLNGADTGQEYMYAPCDCVCKKIGSSGNVCFFESSAPVQTKTHGLTYVSWMCYHMNDSDKATLNPYVGRTYKQGDIIYREGTKGNATGNHVHFCLGIGKFTGSGWHQLSNGKWEMNNAGYLHQECYLAKDVKIRNNGGYPWSYVPDEQPVQPTDPQIHAKPAPQSATNTGVYTKGQAVKLVKQKLFTSSQGNNYVIKTGTFYIYDGENINGRYRVTNAASRICTGKLIVANVSGYIEGGETTTASTAPTAGKAVHLNGDKLYYSSTGTKAYTKNGTYYIYDGKLVNGRYRVTNSPDRVNTGIFNVSGWVSSAVAAR